VFFFYLRVGTKHKLKLNLFAEALLLRSTMLEQARLDILDTLDTSRLARYVERVESSRDVKSQVEFGLYVVLSVQCAFVL